MKYYCQLATLRLLLLSIWLVGIRAEEPDTTIFPVPAIVGGEDAYLGQFPYQVSLIRYSMHWCGASIITHNYVLTAAHCATYMEDNGTLTIVDPSSMSVRVGSIHLNSNGTVIGVAYVFVHPQYNFPNYDMALLLLSEPIEYNDNVQPIPLAKEQPPAGANVVVSGWGYLSTNGVNPEILQHVNLTTIDDATCESDLNAVYNTTFCVTHQPGEGICQGDSGGPCNYNGTLLGVVSFTPGSCDNSLPDGMASVPVLSDWIYSTSDFGDDDKKK